MSSFLDIAKGLVTEASERLSAKFTEIGEVAKLRAEIKEARDMINCLYIDIGKRHYEKRNDSLMEDDFRDFSIIDDKLKKIEELEKDLNKCRVCNNCGASVKEGQCFCSQCGTSLCSGKESRDSDVEIIIEDGILPVHEGDDTVGENKEHMESSDLTTVSYGEELEPFKGENVFHKNNEDI